MLSQNAIKAMFSQANAIIIGSHFVYAKKPDGWYHGPDYVNKDAIYPYVGALSLLCKEIANHFSDHGIEAVVGPSIGAVSLSQWVAYYICSEVQALAVYADEEDVLEERKIEQTEDLYVPKFEFDSFGKTRISRDPKTGVVAIHFSIKTGTRRVLKRGYDKLVSGKRCLVVEDVINSGATAAKTIKAVFNAGGIIAGVGCLCNRSGGRVCAATLGVTELFSLLDLEMKMFKEEECPLCEKFGATSVRIDLGKGLEFLRRRGLS